MSRTKNLLLFAMVASLSSTTMPVSGATNPFQKHATAQTAAFMVSRDPNSTVTVQVIKRPIEALNNEWVRAVVRGAESLRGATDSMLVKAALSSINEEQLVHYQVIVRDASGNIIPSENYGWSAPDGGGVGGFVLSSGTIYSDSDLSRYDANPVAEITTTWGNHYNARKEWEGRAVSMANYSILPFLQGVHISSDEELKMTVLRYVEHCQNSAYVAYQLERKQPNATVTKEFKFPGEADQDVGQEEDRQRSRVQTSWPYYPSWEDDPHYPHRDSESPKDDSRDILDSLENIGETLEGIADERRNLRDDRRKRQEEKRRKEEERKRLEEERLRQQQLAEQRKKKDSQKKDSDKKQDVKKETKKEKTKKDTPTPAPATADIDFSKLNSLISQQASFLRGIISSGQKATSAQHAKFNSLNNQYVSEFNRLKAQIGNISDPAKRSQYYSKLASINSRMNSEVDPLLAQGASRGLFTNL